MIKSLTQGADEAVSTMKECQLSVESSVNETNKSGDALNRIIGFITNMNASIAAAAKQQSVAVGDINHNVSSISDISQHHSDNTQKTAASSQQLSDLSSHLGRIVEKLRMNS